MLYGNYCKEAGPDPALHKKMKFSLKGSFSKCDQIRGKLQIWSYLLKKSLKKNFIFCAVEYLKHLKYILDLVGVALYR